jgi:hypothetical protein
MVRHKPEDQDQHLDHLEIFKFQIINLCGEAILRGFVFISALKINAI